MKTAIKLVLVCLLCQLLGALIASPVGLLISYIYSGEVSTELSIHYTMPLAMLLQFVLMAAYLWKKGYLTGDGNLFAWIKPGYALWVVLAGIGAIILEDALLSALNFLPNLLESTFEQLSQSWLGIACIAVVGPVVEEMLFRGAVTKELLRKFGPRTAIVISGLLFGLIHINPVQVVGAALIGMLLAWLYWRTGSLWPGILLHVVNNSFAVWSDINYPGIDHFSEAMTPTLYPVLLLLGASLFGLSMACLIRYKNPLIEK